jgi:hypothetical protein
MASDMKFGRRKQGPACCWRRQVRAGRDWPGASHGEAAPAKKTGSCELIDDLEAHLAGGAGDDSEWRGDNGQRLKLVLLCTNNLLSG